MSPADKKIHRIVVFNAEDDEEHHTKLDQDLRQNFGQEIDAGVISVISAPPTLYKPIENPCNLSRTHSDSLIRYSIMTHIYAVTR
jgi:hypothetical protein